MNNNIKLIEPGVKYFLSKSLEECKKYKIKHNNIKINMILLISLFLFISSLLYYKYKNRPTLDDKDNKEYLKKTYILNKIKDLNIKQQELYKKSITNLPKFEQ